MSKGFVVSPAAMALPRSSALPLQASAACPYVPPRGSLGTSVENSLFHMCVCHWCSSGHLWNFFKPKCFCHVESHPCESVIPCKASWMWPQMCHPGQDKLPALSISQGTRQGGAGNGCLHGLDTPAVVAGDCICPNPKNFL